MNPPPHLLRPWLQPLTAIVVNYKSGGFALSCLRSLQAEWARCGGDPRDLEIILVDNASNDDSDRWLDTIEREGVRVLRSKINLGYAGAIEWGLGHSQQEGPVMFLNPDLFFLPGSLQSLLCHLASDPALGAVAPRTVVDEDAHLHLPPIALPTAWDECLGTLARAVPFLSRFLARRQSRLARDHWSAWRPQPADMLSGACVLVCAEMARGDEPLLDAAYPLYYEDADLCQRLAARAMHMDWVPAAIVVHHWSRSAGSGSAFEGQPRQFWSRSRQVYMERWSKAPMRWALSFAERLIAHLPAGLLDRTPRGIERLASHDAECERVELALPAEGDLFMELSMTPHFSLCAGIAVCGAELNESWSFPASAWDWLFPGTYFMRAVDSESGAVHATWTFTKVAPARSQALPSEPFEPAFRGGLTA
ncbi:MAG TPA: glycosyltransferase family 2 protein [Planctomycetes bacterium]|nr:glycosyltransferase family 2 protein [Planctomycetota bacterium]HIK61455.1 glycosyltransferase family 2 protein [Planctomycetota bacterium]